MLIYNYDRYTTEYINATEPDIDELETALQGSTVYIIPANATKIVPPKPKKGFAICFNTKLNSWEFVEDHRGTIVYNRDSLEPITLTELGSIPSEYLTDIPEPKDSYQIWKNGEFVYPNLNDLKVQIKQELDDKYQKKIDTPYKFNKYYVQPSWGTIYTNTLVAMQQDMKDNGKLDEEYKVLLIVDPLKFIVTQIKVNNIDEFLPYYNKVKELYKKLTEDYHNKIVAISVTNDAEELVNIINSY